MKRHSIILATVVLLAAITVTTTPAEAAFPGGNGYIVYSSAQPSPHKIWRMNSDGSNQQQLTFGTYDTTPAWSPDGTRIAFDTKRHGGREVYVMNANGSGQTRLTINPGFTDTNSEWSPDGTRIVFQSTRDGNSEIYVMDADGGNQTRITNNTAYDAGPSWSPDGTLIAFVSDRDGDNEIYVMNTDGTGLLQLTNNTASDGVPDWSPDGSKIVFESLRDTSPGEIYVMDADGSNQTRITYNTAVDSRSVWSPDGTKIAFYSNRDGNNEIYVMNANGTEQTRLTYVNGSEYSPSWQPIAEDNRPPVLDPIGNKLGSEGELLEFVVTATDPDPGDTLTFDANNLPEGAIFNSDTDTFLWTPGYDQAGNYEDVEFYVQDDGTPMEVDVELITITIGNVNRAPVFTEIGSQPVDENQLLIFQVIANDPDDDSIILSSGELPEGANFNTTNGIFSWVPDYWTSGTYTVVFSATDDGIPNMQSDLEVIIIVGDVDAPAEMTEEIIEIITSEELGLPHEVENSYVSNVKKVPIFVEKNKLTPAINQLNAFISKVENDIIKGKIDAEVGNDLINKATEIIQKITP